MEISFHPFIVKRKKKKAPRLSASLKEAPSSIEIFPPSLDRLSNSYSYFHWAQQQRSRKWKRLYCLYLQLATPRGGSLHIVAVFHVLFFVFHLVHERHEIVHIWTHKFCRKIAKLLHRLGDTSTVDLVQYSSEHARKTMKYVMSCMKMSYVESTSCHQRVFQRK